MADTGRLDELQRKFDENPRRFFAPLANEYRKSGDLERAIGLCQEYLPQQPGHMSGYIVYGQALFDGARHPEAAEAFKQALAIDPENIIALKYLGDIARYAEDRDNAASWYRRVIELDPRNEEISAYLAGPSYSEPPHTRQHSAAPPPFQTVYPEPTPDPDAVALSDLVEQPDVPVVATPAFGVAEMTVTQFGESATDDVDAREAKAVFDQMFADRLAEQDIGQLQPASGAMEPFEAGWELPLITEFTLSPPAEPPPFESPVPEFAPVEFAVPQESVETPTEASAEAPVEAPVAANGTAPALVPEVQEWGHERGVEPAYEPEPEHGSEQLESLGAAFDTPFVTETMADLYLQQGFAQQALDVYKRLSATGDQPALRDKIEQLERTLAEQESAAAAVSQPIAVPTVTVRDFFASIGARRARGHAALGQTQPSPAHPDDLGALFGATPIDDNDARAASALAGVYPAAR